MQYMYMLKKMQLFVIDFNRSLLEGNAYVDIFVIFRISLQ